MMQERAERRRAPRSKIVIGILLAICAVSVTSGVFFYIQYTNAQAKINEKEDTIKRVSSIVEMPNETPSIMTVADKSKLQNTELAHKLNDGDVLLIFAQNHRIFIYRPSTSKLVDMLSFGTGESQNLQP